MDEQVSAASGLTTGLPVGAVRWRNRYWDADNRSRRSRSPVPVDEFGRISGTGWRCPKCRVPRWLPLPRGKAPGQPVAPVCEVHDRKMLPLRLQRPPLLPYRELWSVLERPLRPVWALPALAAAGFAVDAAPVPALAVAGAAPLVGEVARRLFRRERVAWHVRQGNLDPADRQAHKRRRAAIDRAARKVGYAAGAGAGWLALPAALGVDGRPGAAAWTALVAGWLPAAATWWWMDRHRETPRTVVEEPALETGPDMDPEERRVHDIWYDRMGIAAGDVIGVDDQGRKVLSQRSGRLPGTTLRNWQKVRGGWRATIVGPAGVFESDDYVRARGKIAGAYRASKAMVSLVPSSEDENLCDVLIQSAAVIREKVRWSGPDSIDIKAGRAPFARYVDGSLAQYEIWRQGWGCAHEIFIGSTGSGKTEALQMAFTIDRWANYQRRGLVCDFLIDPQQGQSFSAYIDDLAAPVASTAEEALVLMRAFRREMLRRNAYLSQKTWKDGKGRTRRAVKWWDPIENGPLLFLTIDEAHEFLAIREFGALATAGARMYRKCGMRIRVATHTPLLSDLGGSMALRDMLTGGLVWCGKTNNGLTSGTAFNGRLPADPRSIPDVPGAAYILSPIEQRGMLARTMWEEDFYDFVRDEQDRPIGYPGVLPPETLAAFGGEYAAWVGSAGPGGGGVLWTPQEQAVMSVDADDEYLQDVVLWALQTAEEPLDMAGLDAALRTAGVEASTLSVRRTLEVLRGRGLAAKNGGRHELHPAVRAKFEREMAEQVVVDDDADDLAESAA